MLVSSTCERSVDRKVLYVAAVGIERLGKRVEGCFTVRQVRPWLALLWKTKAMTTDPAPVATLKRSASSFIVGTDNFDEDLDHKI